MRVLFQVLIITASLFNIVLFIVLINTKRKLDRVMTRFAGDMRPEDMRLHLFFPANFPADKTTVITMQVKQYASTLIKRAMKEAAENES